MTIAIAPALPATSIEAFDRACEIADREIADRMDDSGVRFEQILNDQYADLERRLIANADTHDWKMVGGWIGDYNNLRCRRCDAWMRHPVSGTHFASHNLRGIPACPSPAPAPAPYDPLT